MGAGCYYTHNNDELENRRAFWIVLDQDEEDRQEENQYLWDDTLDNLQDIFAELGYSYLKPYTFENGLFTIELESTYYGDGIVIRLEPKNEDAYHPDDIRIYNLAKANHTRSYDKIKRGLLERGYSLRIATSGYTSAAITKED